MSTTYTAHVYYSECYEDKASKFQVVNAKEKVESIYSKTACPEVLLVLLTAGQEMHKTIYISLLQVGEYHS